LGVGDRLEVNKPQTGLDHRVPTELEIPSRRGLRTVHEEVRAMHAPRRAGLAATDDALVQAFHCLARRRQAQEGEEGCTVEAKAALNSGPAKLNATPMCSRYVSPTDAG